MAALPELLIKRYEDEFGKGSWAELERDVRRRNASFFDLYESLPPFEYEPEPKRWWQFWK